MYGMYVSELVHCVSKVVKNGGHLPFGSSLFDMFYVLIFSESCVQVFVCAMSSL